MPSPDAAVAMAGERGRRFHLHIENLSSQDQLFHITPQILTDALAVFPGLADQLEISFGFDLDTFDREMKSADGFVGWKFPCDRFDARAPHLKFIQLTGAGIEHLVPLDWVPDGVAVSNNRGVHTEKAAEFATMAILMLNSRMPLMASNQQGRVWEKAFTGVVRGKTLLIIGLGNMGGAVAAVGQRLGMRVLGVRRSQAPHPSVDEMVAPDCLRAALARTDILVLTAPLTSETRGMIGAAELDLLRPSAGILNIGRGAVMDIVALARKLRNGELSGAILDVFDPEPLPPESELWATPRLLITPHCSSDDVANYARKTIELALGNVERLLRGEPPINLVRRDLGY